MGDERHKKSPPDLVEEEVTDTFRQAAREQLKLNKTHNRLRTLRKGDPGYLISNHAELAVAVGTDKTMINKIIGPVRPTTKVKLVERSVFVAKIRWALRMPDVLRITVDAQRADALRKMNELPDAAFAHFVAVLNKETGR